MTSWEYVIVIVILAFWNHCIFFLDVLVYTSSFSGCSALSTEERTKNTGNFLSVGENSVKNRGKCMEMALCQAHVFLNGTRGWKRGARDWIDRRFRQVEWGDYRLTVRMIASHLDMKKDSVWKIITENLGMHKVCVKIVLTLLNQKERRIQVCQEIIERLQTELDLLCRVITGNETLIF